MTSSPSDAPDANQRKTRRPRRRGRPTVDSENDLPLHVTSSPLPGARADASTEGQEDGRLAGLELPDSAGDAEDVASSPLPGPRADAPTEAQGGGPLAGSELPDSAGDAGGVASSPLPGSRADAPTEARERRRLAGSEMPDSAGGAASSPLPGSRADAPTEAQERHRLAASELPDSAGDTSSANSIHPRVQAMIMAARYQGIELDPNQFSEKSGNDVISAAALAAWAQESGMWARAVKISYRHLLRFQESSPIVLLFTDGSAALQTGANAEQKVVFLNDPFAGEGAAPTAVDELRLRDVWSGEAILVRVARVHAESEAPFSFGWIANIVASERRALTDIGVASFTISLLTIFPPFIVMTVVNRVLQFHSMSTLVLLSAVMAVIVLYETLLGFARRLALNIISARLDAKLNLHVFNRLLRLPLDYFERNPAGETMYKLAQVHRVRAFLTGKLLSTLLDLMTLCVLLPILFLLNATLAWIVLACAVAVSLIIFAFLAPLRTLYSRVTVAESWKSATLGETIVGIRTVKSLALEPQRSAQWDERVTEAGKSQLAFGKLANWPQTLVTPFEFMMRFGTMIVGAYLALNEPSGYMVGSLFAFMMLGGRVAAPLVGLARLVEDYEEVRAAVGEAGSVLNRPLEVDAPSGGLRPQFAGAIEFYDLTFTYPSTKIPALDRVSFSVPPGTMLGVVGRSGSGKSTIARLLQGINRDYSGFIKIDSVDLREINLRHLRQNFGVVLQDNFLFRGSIRDNIIAGRPGLSMQDAVRAARLAGAEEFIERMPNGYNTYIEEGSPNLSGGQRQRLAIARALIHNPRILILDEATSALDPDSEAVVNANLMRIARGRTMVIVSHRLSSLTDCDQILVLEEGKIVDIAPHGTLLDRCSLYQQLWMQQNRHLDRHSRKPTAVPARVIQTR